jgi:hypothetical protein
VTPTPTQAPSPRTACTMGSGGGVPVFSAMLVVLLGLGISALGLLVPDMYLVGLVVLLIGGIGVLVWLGDLYRCSGRSLL